MIHFHRGIYLTGLSHNNGRDSGDGGVWRDVTEDHAAGSDFRVASDFHPAENFRARADEDSGADDGMAIARFLAGAAEGNLVEDGDIILDDGGLTDDEGSGVIKEDAAADFRSRVDIGGKHFRGDALEVEGEPTAPLIPEAVADTVGAEGHESFVKKERLKRGEAGCIPLEHGEQIPAAGAGDVGVVFENFGDEGLDRLAGHVLAGEAAGQTDGECLGEGVPGENDVIDEGFEAWLGPDQGLGFLAEAEPEVFQIRGFPPA